MNKSVKRNHFTTEFSPVGENFGVMESTPSKKHTVCHTLLIFPTQDRGSWSLPALLSLTNKISPRTLVPALKRKRVTVHSGQ